MKFATILSRIQLKLLFALGMLASAILAQTFRSTTKLVRAEALVEESGHVVTGLQSEDFTIVDEGQPQPIANFAAESGSIRLVLLLDASGSMQSAQRQLLRTGLAALSALYPDDMVALMTFDKKATLRVPLTGDRGAVILGVSKATGKAPGGATDIYRALSDAAKYLGASDARGAQRNDTKNASAPNVILILTDNAARADTTEVAALRDLWTASASVDAMVVSSAPLWDEKVSQSLGGLKIQDVRRIADQTGGVIQQTPDIEVALRNMLERGRTRYTLFYRQPDAEPGTLRHLRVDLSPAARAKHPSAAVRSRTAYYAE
jgi:VWFA-related protein